MQLPIGICLGTFGGSYDSLRSAAQLLDDLGFDSVWVWDHYVSRDDPAEPVLEAFATLAGVAEATRRIRLGPLVANNTNRHPGRLAKIAATLQEIAGGRLELGLGSGGWRPEQEAFGIRQGTRQGRTERLVEAIQIIQQLWSGAPVDFHGRYYQLKQAIVAPPPVPRPPIIVGARGARLCRIAGQYADGLNLQWPDRERFSDQLAALDEGLAERGCNRSGFDLSLHARWSDYAADPHATIETWAALGFTRVILYAPYPYPLEALRRLAS